MSRNTLTAAALLVATLVGVTGPAQEAHAFVGGTTAVATCPREQLNNVVSIQHYVAGNQVVESVFIWFRITNVNTGSVHDTGWQKQTLLYGQALPASNLYNLPPGVYTFRIWLWSASNGMIESKVSYRISGSFATSACLVL